MRPEEILKEMLGVKFTLDDDTGNVCSDYLDFRKPNGHALNIEFNIHYAEKHRDGWLVVLFHDHNSQDDLGRAFDKDLRIAVRKAQMNCLKQLRLLIRNMLGEYSHG